MSTALSFCQNSCVIKLISWHFQIFLMRGENCAAFRSKVKRSSCSCLLECPATFLMVMRQCELRLRGQFWPLTQWRLIDGLWGEDIDTHNSQFTRTLVSLIPTLSLSLFLDLYYSYPWWFVLKAQNIWLYALQHLLETSTDTVVFIFWNIKRVRISMWCLCLFL